MSPISVILTVTGGRRLEETQVVGPRCCLTPVGNTEFVENVGDVGLHRARPQEERLGDLFVGLSLRQQAQHINLPLRETGGVGPSRW